MSPQPDAGRRRSQRRPRAAGGPRPDPIPPETLRRLHRDVISGPEVLRILRRLQESGQRLAGGIDHRSSQARARIVGLEGASMQLVLEGLETSPGAQLPVNFTLDATRYFMVARVLRVLPHLQIEASIPSSIYLAEMRDLWRVEPGQGSRAPKRVKIDLPARPDLSADVLDWTFHGLALRIPSSVGLRRGDRFGVSFVDGAEAGTRKLAEVRSADRGGKQRDWTRVGVSTSRVPRDANLRVRPAELSRVPVALEAPAGSTQGFETRRICFFNDAGESLSGIVDRWGPSEGATAVVIPSAWGKTKETLLPLAATIAESFQAAARPVTVLRFDGTRRRGSSFVPDEDRFDGGEHLSFTFSQAVRDTQAAIRFLRQDAQFRTGRVVLVTFSLSAIDARRVVSADASKELAGWISVVGVGDLQSTLRVVSGGVDFGYGLLQGLAFGRQELFGALVDIDRAGRDAIEHKLGFMEDARRDMERIRVPITWLRGRSDAWVDHERVEELMSAGNADRRKILEIPTGHQLRNSREARAVFALISREAAEMSLGETIEPRAPSARALARRRFAEKETQQQPADGFRSIWRDYLLGREGRVGYELLSATHAFRTFMQRQIDLLDIDGESRVLDLGSGPGDFAVRLFGKSGCSGPRSIHAVDFVSELHARARSRLQDLGGVQSGRWHPILADLSLQPGVRSLPLRPASYDAALLSLLVSYVRNPRRLLAEVYEALKSGGRLVVSAPRRDADFSKVYLEAFSERYSDRATEVFGRRAGEEIDLSLPCFLNSAWRIFDLEEAGQFRFFDAEELEDIVRKAGFIECNHTTSLGEPPQVVITAARRP